MYAFPRLFFRKEGAAAVEFALVAPLFFMTVLTMIGYGVYLSASHSLQQIAADAARTAIAGLTANERHSLADTYIRTSITGYAFIDVSKVSFDVQDDVSNIDQFTVTISYDASALPIWNLFTFAMPDREITRYATIRIGGI
ncbi:TadE family protein [Pararhizobium arenae]|jgi:Flp pilus assembly protein TadG|uniref:TadE family protein n=1 Tax=Pararhizobium arenae TaxID=1856850 RepID=UPI00094ADF9F|nr:TadE/TadG family type IV pilus assembly protein [Pararhizobium arenae]